MKISVVADRTGKIVGFSHPHPGQATQTKSMTSFDGDDDQTVHVIELSTELAARAHDDDFADAIFQHVVVKKGKSATLTRSSASVSRATSAKPAKKPAKK